MADSEARPTPDEIEANRKRVRTEFEVRDAIDVVARWALADLVARADNLWSDYYPDIGEHDWERVDARMRDLAERPDQEVYDKAYALLAARCEHDGDH